MYQLYLRKIRSNILLVFLSDLMIEKYSRGSPAIEGLPSHHRKDYHRHWSSLHRFYQTTCFWRNQFATPFSKPGRATTIRANSLKWIVIYLDQRFDSAFSETQYLCKLQGKTTNDTEITESKSWLYNNSSLRTPGITQRSLQPHNTKLLCDKNSLWHLKFLQKLWAGWLQTDRFQAGKSLEKVIPCFHCLTWWQNSVTPNRSLNPAWKHRASLNFMVPAQLTQWKSCSHSCCSVLGLNQNKCCWVIR